MSDIQNPTPAAAADHAGPPPPALGEAALGWGLLALAWVTPLVVILRLVRPPVGQGYVFQLGVLALLAVCGALLAAGRLVPRRLGVAHGLLLLNGLAVGAAIFASREPLYSFKMALLPACAAIWWALLVALPRRRLWIDRATLGCCAVGTLLACYGILQHLGFEFLPYSEQVRKNNVIATLGHPNYLGSLLGPLVFMLAGMWLTARRRLWLVLGSLAMLAMLVCILLARTRGIWLAIGVGGVSLVLLALAYMRRHGLPRLLPTLLAGGALQLVAVVAIVFLILPRFQAGLDVQQLRERLGSQMPIKSRLFYWQTAIREGHQHPWRGIGFGMYNAQFWEQALEQINSPQGAYYQDVLPSISNRTPGHAHNEYLEVFAEQGWPGLAALLALLLYFVQFGARAVLHERDRRLALKTLGAWAALLVTIVDALFAFPWRLPAGLIVLMLSLARLHDALDAPPARQPDALPATNPAPPGEAPLPAGVPVRG